MLKTIYDKAPTFLQNIFLTLQAMRYRKFRQGGKYNEILAFLQQSQFFSKEEIFKWQVAQFQRVFGEAYHNTAYYKRLFDELGVTPANIKDFSFLPNVSVLEKKELRDNPDYFINKARKIVYLAKTGGTTGAPLVTPFDSESTQWASALMARFFEQSGVKYDSRKLHMTGQQVVPFNEKRTFWRVDYLGNSLYLSIHHLSGETFPRYWKRIVTYKPQYVFGYTSFIYDLARHINANGLSGKLILKGVFPSSEKLTDEMRTEMEEAFNCKVFDHYGSTEGIPLITQCKSGNYHVVPESGIIEFLNESGVSAKEGEYAEMVMTSLRQFSRPILRYRIGDTAIPSSRECDCGLNWQVVDDLTGRLSEWITLADGRKISQFSHQVFKVVSNVAGSQIIQHDFDKFTVYVVKGDKFNKSDEDAIIKRFHELISDGIELQISYVNEIPKTAGGKRPSLISKVS